MSNFIVSARKYRPLQFDDVVGQQHVSQTLKNALRNDHLAHAFLFCGPRGVGKTTCARILAKILNCQSLTEQHEPCNTCSSCDAFNKNASFNITELDAASNNSVEHIRALIEQVRFQPQQGKYKVFIIDEVHMLSQQAFNAFLKTLEEPPPYAIFILATTEKHKIIPTILSRCQIFDFRRIQIPDMVAHLEGICQQEGIAADKDALHIIAQKADGALRDALSIFDRIVSFSGNSITYQDVITNLNVLDYDYYFKIVDTLLTSDLPNLLLTFDDILRKGFDADIFVTGLAEHIRNVLVCKDEKTLKLLETGDALRQKYQRQAALAPQPLLLTALSICNQCDVDYKMARNKRLHVEMALVKMCHINQAVEQYLHPPVPVAAPQKKTPDTNESLVKDEKTAYSKVSDTKKSAPPKGNAKFVQPARLVSPKITSLKSLEAEVEKQQEAESQAIPPSPERAGEIWRAYIESVGSPSVKNTMKAAKLDMKEETLIISVGTGIAENNIRQESGLFPFLRKESGYAALLVEIRVDATLAPKVERPKVKQFMDRKTKLKVMYEQNPSVAALWKTLDLKWDE